MLTDRHCIFRKTVKVIIAMTMLLLIGSGCSIETEIKLKLIDGNVKTPNGIFKFQKLDKTYNKTHRLNRPGLDYYALTNDLSIVYSSDGYFIITVWPAKSTLFYEQGTGSFQEDGSSKQSINLRTNHKDLDLESTLSTIVDYAGKQRDGKQAFRKTIYIDGRSSVDRSRADVPYKLNLQLTINNTPHVIDLHMVRKSRKKLIFTGLTYSGAP